MILNHTNNIPWFTFSNLEPFQEIFHGIFTRNGGVSAHPFDSLNTAMGIGDDPECVMKNRERILKVSGLKRLVFARQVHETGVLVYKNSDQNIDQNIDQDDYEPQTGDAMITDIPGLCLAIQVADCQPVLVYDPRHRVVANIHSGWKGSIQNIIAETINTMKVVFNTSPEDIVAGIGPSLGQCCAEFINYRTEIPKRYWVNKNESDHIDFWAISCKQLEDAGVKKDRINIGGLCTKCSTDHFFSYRKEKTTGRFSALIGIQ
ncbi:peptidoglycan editing factor PgeF [Desulfobacterales bacterium HSG16]|nr:peptidoglycan editing factor PgeF [Desulfobacterales bacterium HSG16]